MSVGRFGRIAVALAALAVPLAAFAQVPNNYVTTDPFAASAPVLGMPLLLLLVVVLAGIAAYRLRRTAGRAIAALGFVAALSLFAGLGYAITMMMTLTVQGAQCAVTTTQPFNPFGMTTLVSHCPNAIRIVDIHLETSCMLGMSVDPCQVDQVLTDAQSCALPFCAFD